MLGLQGLLGRLNGDGQQIEQVKKEEERRKNELVASKWGMRFVRGEVWVADDLTKLRARILKDREAQARVEIAQVEEEKHSKQKKRKRALDADRDAKDEKQSCTPLSATSSGDEAGLQSRKHRKEKRRIKRELKEARRKERAERREKKAQRRKEMERTASSDSGSEPTSVATTRSATPAMNGRHAVRAKYIAAKRSAVVDAASLNEVG